MLLIRPASSNATVMTEFSLNLARPVFALSGKCGFFVAIPGILCYD